MSLLAESFCLFFPVCSSWLFCVSKVEGVHDLDEDYGRQTPVSPGWNGGSEDGVDYRKRLKPLDTFFLSRHTSKMDEGSLRGVIIFIHISDERTLIVYKVHFLY